MHSTNNQLATLELYTVYFLISTHYVIMLMMT